MAVERWTTPGRVRKAVLVGIAGAMLLVAGIGAYVALIRPPYQSDESSHVGYMLSLERGTLPSLDTKVPEIEGEPTLDAALRRPWPFSLPYIHVAINPPWPYVYAMPYAEVTERAGIRSGPLLGVRLADLSGMVIATGLAYLLGRELSGGDRLAGLGTAGLVGGSLSVATSGALANIEGIAFATTTSLTWSLARFARAPTARHALLLGACAALAAGTRSMALALALVAAAVGVAVALRSVGWRRLPGMAARIVLPMVIFAGWFYLVNWHRYGDPTGARRVYELSGYQSQRGIFDILWGPEAFVQPFAYLVTQVYGLRGWWGPTSVGEYLITVAAVVVLVAAVALAAVLHKRAADPDQRPLVGPHRPPLSSWLAMCAMAPVPMVLVARHMSNGGAGHPRYLFPVLPILAAAVMVLAVRMNRWLSLALVAISVGFELARVQTAGHLNAVTDPIFGKHLANAIMGQQYRYFALAMAGLGALLLVGSLAATAWFGPPGEHRAEPETG